LVRSELSDYSSFNLNLSLIIPLSNIFILAARLLGISAITSCIMCTMTI